MKRGENIVFIGFIGLLLSLIAAVILSKGFLSAEKRNPNFYLLACYNSVEISSKLANVLSFAGETYGITLDPTKYCSFTTFINLDKDFLDGTACQVIKNAIKNKQFYYYLVNFYGKCSPQTAFEENNGKIYWSPSGYEWAKVYMALILARQMEVCNNIYYGKHPEDIYHLNIFPCGTITFFTSFTNNNGKKPWITEADIFLTYYYATGKLLESVAEQKHVASFISIDAVRYYKPASVRLVNSNIDSYQVCFKIVGNRCEKSANIDWKLVQYFPIKDNRFVFFYYPPSKTYLNNPVASLRTIEPGDTISIYYFDPITTKSVADLIGMLISLLVAAIFSLILSVLSFVSSIGKIVGSIAIKIASSLASRVVSGIELGIFSSKAFKLASWIVGKIIQYQKLIFVVATSLWTTVQITGKLPIFDLLAPSQKVAIYSLAYAKKTALELNGNTASFGVLVAKASETDVQAICNYNKVTKLAYLAKYNIDCQIPSINGNSVQFKVITNCPAKAVFVCSVLTEKCYKKPTIASTINIDLKEVSNYDDDILFAGYVFDDKLARDFSYKTFQSYVNKQVPPSSMEIFFVYKGISCS